MSTERLVALFTAYLKRATPEQKQNLSPVFSMAGAFLPAEYYDKIRDAFIPENHVLLADQHRKRWRIYTETRREKRKDGSIHEYPLKREKSIHYGSKFRRIISDAVYIEQFQRFIELHRTSMNGVDPSTVDVAAYRESNPIRINQIAESMLPRMPNSRALFAAFESNDHSQINDWRKQWFLVLRTDQKLWREKYGKQFYEETSDINFLNYSSINLLCDIIPTDDVFRECAIEVVNIRHYSEKMAEKMADIVADPEPEQQSVPDVSIEITIPKNFSIDSNQAFKSFCQKSENRKVNSQFLAGKWILEPIDDFQNCNMEWVKYTEVPIDLKAPAFYPDGELWRERPTKQMVLWEVEPVEMPSRTIDFLNSGIIAHPLFFRLMLRLIKRLFTTPLISKSVSTFVDTDRKLMEILKTKYRYTTDGFLLDCFAIVVCLRRFVQETFMQTTQVREYKTKPKPAKPESTPKRKYRKAPALGERYY